MSDPIVIVNAKRTAIGSLSGYLSESPASALGATTIKACLEGIALTSDCIDQVIMGCVLTAGQGQAPARQATISAGLPANTGAITINKMCGSGMQAVMLTHDLITAGSADIMIAGGMESMSQAPYLMKHARQGYRLGHDVLHDHVLLDGLEDAYEPGKLMGVFAEKTATKERICRSDQDNFAIESLTRAKNALTQGMFQDEIAPHLVSMKKETLTIDKDEQPLKAKVEKIPKLPPVFDQEGTITAANASSISDGAASLLLMRASTAKKHKLMPLAKINAHSTYATQPCDFTIAPIHAIQLCLQKAGWKLSDIDLFEINEAFAVVTLAAINALKLSQDQVNIHGGACALGHPIGASGARILVTLIHALKHYQLKRGIASLCIGGGEATAIAVELY